MKKSDKSNFSSEFFSYVGEGNLVPDTVSSEIERFYVAQSNLEALFSYSCRMVDCGLIDDIVFVRKKFPEYFKFAYGPNLLAYNAIGKFSIIGNPRNELFEWEIPSNDKSSVPFVVGKEKGSGFVDLYATLYGVSIVVAFRIISEKYKLTEKNLFEATSEQFFLVEMNDSCLDRGGLPNKIVCRGNVTYNLNSFFDLCTTAGIAGSLALYVSNELPEKELVVPCYVSVFSREDSAPCMVCEQFEPGNHAFSGNYFKNDQKYLTIGVKNIRLLYGSDKMSSLANDVVIVLCESVLVALKLIRHIEKNFSHISEKYFVTTWWGGSDLVEHVDFTYLEGKSVIFIPSLNMNSYNKVGVCHEKCLRSFVKKFSIVLTPIVGSFLPRRGDLEKMKRYEKFFASKVINVSEFDKELFLDVMSGAVTFEKFHFELAEKGFWSGEQNENKHNIDLPGSIESLEIDGDSMTSFSYDKIFQNKKIGLILGANDSGKSIFVLSILYAISRGVSMFGIEAITPRNVLLIDGETDADVLRERYDRIKSAYGSGPYNGSDNNLRVEGFPRDRRYDFSEQSSKMRVESWVALGNIDVVVFDNLNTLIPGVVQDQTKVKNFFIWLRELEQRFKISIILVHHTKKDFSGLKMASGSKEIEEKSQTVVALTGWHELKEKYKDRADHLFHKCQNNGGALLEFYVNKCKHVHVFDRLCLACYLRLDKDEPTIGPKWKVFSVSTEGNWTVLNDTHGLDINNNCRQYGELDEDQQKVMELAMKKNRFTRRDVDLLLACSDEKSRKILNSLIIEGLIEKITTGTGDKKTYYILTIPPGGLHDENIKRSRDKSTASN